MARLDPSDGDECGECERAGVWTDERGSAGGLGSHHFAPWPGVWAGEF